MKQRCILLYAMPYNITDSGTGETNSGISLWYLTLDDLKPQADMTRGSKGIAPCKNSVDPELAPQLTSLPGIYDVDFAIRTVQNKPTLMPVGFEYVGDVVIADHSSNRSAEKSGGK